LEGKSQLLAIGNNNCAEFIQQPNENRLERIAGCNAEETLEVKILEGDSINFSFNQKISKLLLF